MFGGIGLVYAKTFKSRLLIFFLCLILVFACPLSVYAYTLDDIQWENTNATSIISQVYELKPSDGYTNSLTTSTGYVQYNYYPEYVLNFRFTAKETIFKYLVTNLHYQFRLYCNDSNFTFQSIEFYMIHNGVEYPMFSSGAYAAGWLQKLYTQNTNTLLDVKAVVKGQQFINHNFTRAQYDNDTVVKLNKSLTFSLALEAFNQYESSDNMLEMSNKIDTLVNDASGIQGAIENQTDQQHADAIQQNQNLEIQNQLQEEQNQLQQESNAQNKNFMDNFFGNLGNTVLGWIVPSSEQITAFFDEVNAWFSDRLGFVWYPFDLAYQLVSAFALGDANTNFKVPGFTLNFQGQQLTIWNPIEVNIDAFGIFSYVRFFTSAIIVCGVIKMAIDKWDEWIGGHAK